MLYYQTKFGCKQASSLEDITEIVIFGLYKPSLTLTLKTVNQFLCKTLWLMKLHSHTKFDDKIFFGSEDIQKNIH